MADLESLIRLRRHTVEEKQKILAEIFRQVEIVDRRKKELLERLEKERKALDENFDIETRAYYGRFEGVIRGNIAKLDKELKKLETRVQLAQEEVRAAFADMKRVEIVHKRRQAEEAQAIKDKESQELDEIGIEGFRRNQE
ncbi:MAG: flagellar FliJ family protein [Alphaproteobacteria bacterium]|nr:flagellar FliJ family protein [Alphaproteobacteria bacterium]